MNEFLPAGRINRTGFLWRHAIVLPPALWLARQADSLACSAGTLASALLLLFLISAWTRRLHDLDRSGWRLLLAALPLFGPIILIATCLRPGRAIANRYGSAPGLREDYTTVQAS
ncbi:hypothetical protein AWB61_10600 [Chromobacterium sp. F49]|uniref:DUF805 domain-containing protein n=1 Tax=Chromobacterium subtsugae TaxID=251747 RepID=UPI00064133F4|nr:DUF805 domain-containing protein [Chromobacterium subtsugae]KZE87626.1 hypothetical protein AWB61_10600 [Chromobacterium sp. F49]KUM03454.1 hypothetical protein Cv017_18970 [Chromobacterium subtsugae]MBW7567001.1 DUF805 domain-containing protein [Chromobacterium subtsugae]WSE90094.1 DUF805 domain-containing protein [Chromobacterium subtsugae]WVH58466.1 DUF805 domain-containing protein [Chromobacterium subtsugae]